LALREPWTKETTRGLQHATTARQICWAWTSHTHALTLTHACTHAGGLSNLLSGASEEVIHVVLEAVVTLIKANGEVAVALEPAMMPTLLQVRQAPEFTPLPRFAKLIERRSRCRRPTSVVL